MAGSLAIPNTFATPPANAKRPGADLDLNFTNIAAYINVREITVDILANRPAAGIKGSWFAATDVQGGTLYADTGAAWVQVASGVFVQAPSNTVFVLATFRMGSL
jgi:hypothetical protein